MALLIGIFLVGLYSIFKGCPVAVGDRVTLGDQQGTVATVKSWAAGTQNCVVGVKWDSGDSTYIEGWKLNEH